MVTLAGIWFRVTPVLLHPDFSIILWLNFTHVLSWNQRLWSRAVGVGPDIHGFQFTSIMASLNQTSSSLVSKPLFKHFNGFEELFFCNRIAQTLCGQCLFNKIKWPQECYWLHWKLNHHITWQGVQRKDIYKIRWWTFERNNFSKCKGGGGQIKCVQWHIQTLKPTYPQVHWTAPLSNSLISPNNRIQVIFFTLPSTLHEQLHMEKINFQIYIVLPVLLMASLTAVFHEGLTFREGRDNWVCKKHDIFL